MRLPGNKGMICGGTFTTSIYEAISIDEQNSNCQLVLQEGLPDCIELWPEVHDDVLTWMKDQGNDYNDGGACLLGATAATGGPGSEAPIAPSAF